MAREQITRGRLRAQITVQPIESGKVCIFCPAQVSDRLFKHLADKQIALSPPRRAIFGRYPEDELIVTLSHDEAQTEVNRFVGGLPDVCYERDVA